MAKRAFVSRIVAGLWRRINAAFCTAIYQTAIRMPGFRCVRETAGSQNPVLFRYWCWQKLLGFNRKAYWPVHFSSRINQPQNILLGIDTAPGYEPGCYIQAIAPIRIGSYTQIAANVGIIAAGHTLTDLRSHEASTGISIGAYCWLGFGSVILPGVELGDFTIVGANAVVSHSFPDGHCVIAGLPARKIRELNPDECVRFENDVRYHGYIAESDFPDYCERLLRVRCPA